MNAAIFALLTLASFLIGYRFYSRYLSSKLFGLDDTSPTPATLQRDGVDYVPSSKGVLFGHHFASIAGAAPIVGPAVAVIWGWLPALLWVVLGTLFMGAAHDLGTLVLSMRHKGQSIGQLTASIIGPRSRALFLIVIFFLIWLVIAVFALVIANLFISFPASVFPVNLEIIIAVALGYLVQRKGKSLGIPSFVALVILFVAIFVGTQWPFSLEPWFGENQKMAWIVFLLIYSFIASVLPVWTLLQPRDYINSHQLFVGLGALLIGLMVVQPKIVAPAFNPNPIGAPFWFPFLFITIACGAISGFHGLVSSGTTSKQVAKWQDARAIGYGGMLGEGLLALVATLAVTAGFSTAGEWHAHYGSWEAAKGLAPALNAFVMGCARFLSGLGIPQDFGNAMIAVMVISFAATSLDTAARIQRHVIAEVGELTGVKGLKNRYIGAFIAVGTAFVLMVTQAGGQGGLTLWPLFGATNQMLAALSLVIISVFLMKQGKPVAAYILPMIFLLIVTGIGLAMNAISFFKTSSYLLAWFSIALLVVEFWIAGEGMAVLAKARRTKV